MSWYDDAEKVVTLQSKHNYRSSLSLFLQRAKTITKRRVLIIVSDFLDLEDDDIALFEWLDERHVVVTYKINVPIVIGKNFDVSTSLSVPA